MKQFYRRNICKAKVSLDCLEYYTLNWQVTDVNNQCVVQSFGTTQDASSVYTEFTGFYPYFYIKLNNVKGTGISIKSILSKFPEHILKQSDFISEKCSIDFKKDFYGYHPENSPFCKLSFKSLKALEAAKRFLSFKKYFSGYSISLYESNSTPILRFIHQYNIVSCGKITLKNTVDISNRVNTSCNINISCHVSNIVSSEQTLKSIPYIVASFDIESFSDSNNFPNADFEKDCITHISTTFKINGSDDILCQSTISLNSLNFDEHSHTCVSSEKELLVAFQKLIINMDPDIVYSYNGDLFDWQYVFKRCKRWNVPLQIGKIRDEKCTMTAVKFVSCAFGENVYQRVTCRGRFLFDILIYITREYKETCYKLDYIAQKYVDHAKHPVTVQQMFDSYRHGDLALSKTVAEYCQQDAVLPLKLVDKLHMLQVLIGMANVCFVPIEYLIFKGQQIKAYSQILRATTLKNFCIPSKIETPKINYVGATVLEPLTGVYLTPVTVVDFKSLYPSIIRAHNLCYSTFVINGNETSVSEFKWADDTGNHCYQFVDKKKAPGIIPELLKVLGDSREASKKQRSRFKKTDFEYVVYDKLQNAYKLSMNSIYGFLAAQTLTCAPIAATVTRVGRTMLEKTANYITKQHGDVCQVVYGDTDSVFYNNKKGGLAEAMTLGPVIADAVTKLFEHPIELEFEKVYNPLILFGKKRYCGALYSKLSDTFDYIDQKGVQTQRRDNCYLLRRIYSELLDVIIAKETEKCLPILKNAIDSLRRGELLSDLIISKTLKSTYKNNNLPHVVVANKRRERGEIIPPNERIEYVFKVTDGPKNEPQYKKAEDPKFVIENNIPIDYDYYIKSQLEKPLTALLELLFDKQEILDCFGYNLG